MIPATMKTRDNEQSGSPIISVARGLDNVLSHVTKTMALIGVSALVLAILVVVGDVIWRRIGGHSFIGSVDLTQFSVVIAASFAIPYAFSQGSHVRVDLISGFMSDRFVHLLDVTAHLFAAMLLLFILWLTVGRAREIWTYGDVSQDLAIPMVFFWGALVLGLALSVIVSLVKAIILLLGKGTA